MSEPKWLGVARKYLGLKEIPGKANNPTILNWWRALKIAINTDEVPWCAGFVGGVLEEAGYKSSGSAAARSYANKWGVQLAGPAVGAVVVFWRGSPTAYTGHVGFIAGKDKWGHLMVLGGNQGDKVCIKPFVPNRVVGYFWPKEAAMPAVGWATLPYLGSDGKPSTNEA